MCDDVNIINGAITSASWTTALSNLITFLQNHVHISFGFGRLVGRDDWLGRLNHKLSTVRAHVHIFS